LKFHVLSLGDFASKGEISELFIFSLIGEEKCHSFLRKIILYEPNCWSYVCVSGNHNCGIAFVAQKEFDQFYGQSNIRFLLFVP